jgi:hypothetical protein
MRGAIPPLHQYVFMVWCLVNHRGNCTFWGWEVHGNGSGSYPVVGFDIGSVIRALETGIFIRRRVYPKVSGLAAWSEDCKWYSSLHLGAVVSLFCESV